MKNKLQLAIICTILQFLLPFLSNNFAFSVFTGDGYGAGGGAIIYFLRAISSLGTLPFFIALYKSKGFISMIDQESIDNPPNIKDQNWLKHFLIRLLGVAGTCLLLSGIAVISRSTGLAYFIAYAIAIILGISAVVLAIEAIVLFQKKLYYKFFCSLILAGMAFIFVFQLL